ncbi:MAG: SHOCT domain-containing protein [Lapillicoccus sp.]
MSLMMVVVIGAVGLLGVWLLRQGRNARTAPLSARSARAEQELAERFGRGEMDEQQYTRARRVLQTGTTPEAPPS